MGKSSFMGQLGKSFVRSAVNQVGRDTGKVFSNQVYQGAHATPIYHPNNGGVPQFNPGTIGQSIPQGYTRNWKKSSAAPISAGKMIMFLLASVFLFPFGSFCVLAYRLGIFLSNPGNQVYSQYYNEVVYVPDKRYRDGMRPNGVLQKERSVLLPPTAEDIITHKENGKKILIWCGIATAIMVTLLIIAFLK